HSVRDDRRRPGRFDRDARDVHLQVDARFPRLRLRIGAGGADVRAVADRDVGLPALHAADLDMIPLKRKAVVWLAAIVVAVNGFFPAAWILLTSFKTETELIASPITYWPQAPTLANYETAFTTQPILRFMFNSFVVASSSTMLCVLVGALAAYALTR